MPGKLGINHSIQPKNGQKSRYGALVHLVIGLAFFFNITLSNNSLYHFGIDFMKGTNQSNLLALIVVILYLIAPYCWLFKYNFLILFSANNLFLTGFGFWLILFPTGFAGLSDGIVPVHNHKIYHPSFSENFFYIGNHLIAQISFFGFMMSAFKSTTNTHLRPIRFSTLFSSVFCGNTFYILVFIVAFSLFTKIFPVYGIFTNFNPQTPYRLLDGSKLFSGRIVVSTIILLYLISLLICFFNGRIAIQYHDESRTKYLNQIDQ